jgi:uncharacterized protein YqjF (DUF2071 family)
MSCGQINYRAYVHAQGERGVWFFGTALDQPLVVVPCILWQMPWHRAQIRIGSETGRLLDLARRDGSPVLLDHLGAVHLPGGARIDHLVE